MAQTLLRAGLALALLALTTGPAAAQGFDDLEGPYALKIDSARGSACPTGPVSMLVDHVDDRTIRFRFVADGRTSNASGGFNASARTYTASLPGANEVGTVTGSFTRQAGTVAASLLAMGPGDCVMQLSGTKSAASAALPGSPAPPAAAPPAAPGAAPSFPGLPGAADPPGMDPPAAAPADTGLVLFGLDETKLLLIGAGVLFVIGLLYGLLGGRRAKIEDEPEAFVQAPPREPPAPVATPEPTPPPPPPEPEPAPPQAAPPIGAAPEPEPVAEPEPSPEPEPQPDDEPEAPLAGAGHAPPPKPAKPRKPAPKAAAKPAARAPAKPAPRPRPKKPKT